MSAKGEVNLSPYSFFNAFSDQPNIVAFSSSGRKDAVTLHRGDAASSSATSRPTICATQMNATSAPLARGENEMEHAGLTAAPSQLVKPPRVAEAPAALECKLAEDRPARSRSAAGRLPTTSCIGQVVGVYIDDRFIQNGLVDTAAHAPDPARPATATYFVATPGGASSSMTRPRRRRRSTVGPAEASRSEPFEMRTIEHLAIEPDDACAGILGERVHDAPRPRQRLGGGREGLVDHRDLGRVDGHLGGEAVAAGACAFARRPSWSRKFVNTVSMASTSAAAAANSIRCARAGSGSVIAALGVPVRLGPEIGRKILRAPGEAGEAMARARVGAEREEAGGRSRSRSR